VPDYAAFVLYELALTWKKQLPFLWSTTKKRLLYISMSRRLIDSILDSCLDGWSSHMTSLAMKEIDKQAREIVRIWEIEDLNNPKPIIIEHEPGEKHTSPLGGPIEIKAPWL